MAMVNVVIIAAYRRGSIGSGWSAWSKGHLVLRATFVRWTGWTVGVAVHCYDDSTLNIVVAITITIYYHQISVAATGNYLPDYLTLQSVCLHVLSVYVCPTWATATGQYLTISPSPTHWWFVSVKYKLAANWFDCLVLHWMTAVDSLSTLSCWRCLLAPASVMLVVFASSQRKWSFECNWMLLKGPSDDRWSWPISSANKVGQQKSVVCRAKVGRISLPPKSCDFIVQVEHVLFSMRKSPNFLECRAVIGQQSVYMTNLWYRIHAVDICS